MEPGFRRSGCASCRPSGHACFLDRASRRAVLLGGGDLSGPVCLGRGRSGTGLGWPSMRSGTRPRSGSTGACWERSSPRAWRSKPPGPCEAEPTSWRSSSSIHPSTVFLGLPDQDLGPLRAAWKPLRGPRREEDSRCARSGGTDWSRPHPGFRSAKGAGRSEPLGIAPCFRPRRTRPAVHAGPGNRAKPPG